MILNRKQPREIKLSKKRIRAMADIWADSVEEKAYMCSLATDIIVKEKLENQGIICHRIRSFFVNYEVNKCIDCGIIEDPHKIAAMLGSQDYEMSQLAMEIIYTLREKRINEKVKTGME